MSKIKKVLLPLLLTLCLTITACSSEVGDITSSIADQSSTIKSSAPVSSDDLSVVSSDSSVASSSTAASSVSSSSAPAKESSSAASSKQSGKVQGSAKVSLASIPAYSGSAYVAINNNVPGFSESDLTRTSFETYSDLDSLGRCGVAYANIGTDLMPTEERGSIGQVKPTGWHTVKYDCVDGKYLYNRCHLIGYQLTAENANTRNLITGTRYLNIQGMLPFENMVADYIKETKNHVLYRVTPIFDGSNLVATGVQMEALSVEDNGDGICFNVFCYNVQPGVVIDYSTGDSHLADDSATSSKAASSSKSASSSKAAVSSAAGGTTATYILNTNTHKFHKPSCSSVKQMSEANKEEYTGSRADVIAQGYEPCKKCNP